MTETVCPMCAARELSERRDGDLARYVCDACAFEFSTDAQLESAERTRTARIAREEGLFSPDEIRLIRQSFAFTQAQFEQALGVGRKTVVRWESGTVPPSGSAQTSLWFAKHAPDAFLSLAASRGVIVGRRYVHAFSGMAAASAIAVPTPTGAGADLGNRPSRKGRMVERVFISHASSASVEVTSAGDR